MMSQMMSTINSNTNSLQRRRQRIHNLPQKSKSPRIRSASVGRSRDYDLRCRYWAFLFDNLNRAVDEIYQNCEKDESIVECKEAIMVLDNYTREFQGLIQWLNLNIDYESTPPPNRPNSLCWEVRKSQSNKQMTFWNTFFNRNNANNSSTTKSSSDKNENNINSNEEKENIKNVDSVQNFAEIVIENKVLEQNNEIESTQENKFVAQNKIDGKNEDSDAENKKKTVIPIKSDSKNMIAIKSTIETIASTKPLNPLARSFKSRIHSTPTTTTITASQTATIKKISTNSKTAAFVVANGVSQTTTVLKRAVVSTPDLSVNSKESVETKKTEPKLSVPVINKNFIKETNSSRAKNVKNTSNNLISKSNNILSTRNSKEVVKQNNINVSKNKKVKDADGWELVRGRQRYKASPPKVIIVEDESVIKTTADGTVIAVTAASQTNDDWEPLAPGMCSSWSNQTDTDLLRTPGRALQMHEKFSSPSRKRSLSESIKRSEEKLAKAQEAREKFLEKKAQKFKGIVKKVEEMKAWKEEQQLQLKISMEMKLQRAEEKRQLQLKKIVRKAHDEESKVNEIQFINSLEAQNKKYDILNKEKDHELRLQDLHEERLRKSEEKAAKEAAAEERRKAIEEERQARILELKERRKLKDQKIEQQLQEKEKERQEMATQKALDRQSRISAINEKFAANIEELQKKIQQKQDESKRRHEENMESIRQKALELSVKKSSSDDAPICVPYDTMKMCDLCQVIIRSEVFLFGHLRGKKHNDAICEQNGGKVPTIEELENYNLKHIIEAPKESENDIKAIQNCDNERLKAARKRCKKLKQRLINKANQFESIFNEKISENKNIKNNNKIKIGKLYKELNLLSGDTQITGQWPSNMVHSFERVVNELEKILRSDSKDSLYFYSLNGISLLTKLLSRILSGNKERPTSLTDRANAKLANIYEIICAQHFHISDYVLQSNNMLQILDILIHRINLLDTNWMSSSSTSTSVSIDVVIGALCRLLSSIFNSLYCHYSKIAIDNTDDCLSFEQRIQDVISYIISIGMIDKLSLFMSNIRGPIDETPELAYFFQNIISLFTSITSLMTLRCDNIFGAKIVDDETQFMMTLRMTHICGVVSLIYGMLLHSGAPVRGDNVPPIAPKHTLDLTLEAIQFINHVSLLDLTMIQSILGGEGLSLQLRHICSYLIWYCSHNKTTHLLHEVILLIGNFVVLNNENQTLIQSGQRPTVVQQLCSLPFEYFCDEKLSRILFPTLISCCFNNSDNRIILEQEMSTLMLSTFIESTIVNLQLKAVDAEFMAKPKPTLAQERWSFAVRFPKNRWNEAKDYFESQTKQSMDIN